MKIIIGIEQGHTHMAQNSKRKKGLVVKHLSATPSPLPVSNVPFKFILNLYKKIRTFFLCLFIINCNKLQPFYLFISPQHIWDLAGVGEAVGISGR